MSHVSPGNLAGGIAGAVFFLLPVAVWFAGLFHRKPRPEREPDGGETKETM